MTSLPILYSFRRCPYAMRARLAIAASGQTVELREVVLRDKPQQMLDASPKGTVPVLVLPDGIVLEESLDLINWALNQNDPKGWRDFPDEMLGEMDALVAECDGSFKNALDRYKYPNRYDNIDPLEQREKGSQFIRKLDVQLVAKPYLFGARFSFADAAILPFVRQFAHVDRDWFWDQDWPNIICWLEAFLESEQLVYVMKKYPKWKAGDELTVFPQCMPS